MLVDGTIQYFATEMETSVTWLYYNKSKIWRIETCLTANDKDST